MEKNLKPDEASRIDKCLSLVRKAIIINKISVFIDISVALSYNFMEFHFYSKINKENHIKHIHTDTIHFSSEWDFDEKFLLMNHKLNYLVKNGYMPI